MIDRWDCYDPLLTGVWKTLGQWMVQKKIAGLALDTMLRPATWWCGVTFSVFCNASCRPGAGAKPNNLLCHAL
jgi:hypothetical protein